MIGQSTTKVRLVRCPGCRGILPELAPVYQCAGCGKILRAKKRENDSTDTRPPLRETDTAQKNDSEHVSNEQITQSSSQEETRASTGELPCEKNFGSDQSEIRDSSGEKTGGDTKFLSDLSTELTGHVYEEEMTPAVSAETKVYQDECSAEQNYAGYENEHGYGNGKQPEDVSFSYEAASSTEPNHHQSEESSPVAGDHSEEDIGQYNGTNETVFGNCNGKQLRGMNFSDGIASSSELYRHESEESSPLTGVHSEVDENKNYLEQNNGKNHTEFEDHKSEWPGNIKFLSEVSSSAELTCQEIEESSPVVGTSTELDENFKSRFIFGSFSVENLLAANPKDRNITAQTPSNESNLADDQMSPHSEQLEQSQERPLNGFDHVSSEDSLENFALAKRSSAFSVPLKDLPKSPTTRSYYAYDGSVSSYDGTDDHVPDLPLQLSRRKPNKAVSASAEAMAVRDEVEQRNQAWNRSSFVSEQEHYAMKGSKWCEDELMESTRHGHGVRSRMKFETDEYPSDVPFYSRGYQSGSENGSLSNYGRNDFQSSTIFQSLNRPQHPEEEKMELLKMVYELQDQLNRTQLSEGKAKGRFPGDSGTKKNFPSYYDRIAPEEEPRHDLYDTGFSRRCNQGRCRTHQSRISQIPFPAEPTTSRHQVDRSCLHFCPEDRHCSSALPPHICCNKNQYTAHPRQKYYDPYYPSGPSTPQHYTSSEFSSQSCDAQSDDHWHGNHHEVMKFSRERHHSSKRHVLPVVGAAPFLICYGCSKLLQLPADFLLFGRRCHRLRCSACRVLLKFSLRNGTHILPYADSTPDAVAPLPSKIDGYSDSNNGYSPHAEPVSCSDDCGPSVRQSWSTEGEPFTPPLHALRREPNDRKMSSGGSFKPMEEREEQPIFKESQNKYKINPVKTHESPGSTSKRSKAGKLSSEGQGFPPRSGSPLHRLLGYSSPSEVLDRS